MKMNLQSCKVEIQMGAGKVSREYLVAGTIIRDVNRDTKFAQKPSQDTHERIRRPCLVAKSM